MIVMYVLAANQNFSKASHKSPSYTNNLVTTLIMQYTK